MTDHEARVLALELHGLASHRYPQHQMTVAVADALDAVITGVVLHAHPDGYMGASLWLARMGGLIDVPANLVAALAMAIHLGLPVWCEQEPDDGMLGDTDAHHDVPRAFRDAFEED